MTVVIYLSEKYNCTQVIRVSSATLVFVIPPVPGCLPGASQIVGCHCHRYWHDGTMFLLKFLSLLNILTTIACRLQIFASDRGFNLKKADLCLHPTGCRQPLVCSQILTLWSGTSSRHLHDLDSRIWAAYLPFRLHIVLKMSEGQCTGADDGATIAVSQSCFFFQRVAVRSQKFT